VIAAAMLTALTCASAKPLTSTNRGKPGNVSYWGNGRNGSRSVLKGKDAFRPQAV